MLVLAFLASGCSGSSPAAPSSPGGVATASSTTSSSPGPGTDRSIALTCSDAGSGSLSDDTGPSLVVGSLTFEGLRATVKDVSRAVDVGLRVPAELTDWHFRKAPIYLPARAPSVTLTMNPGVAAVFAWVPAQVWTSGSADLTRWATTSVTFASCPDRTATYFGGIAAETPRTCVRFQVGAAPYVNSVALGLDGRGC
ncbi:MAG TPA: hypothetical protein VI357_05605 [Mycobacteriales bacterium]